LNPFKLPITGSHQSIKRINVEMKLVDWVHTLAIQINLSPMLPRLGLGCKSLPQTTKIQTRYGQIWSYTNYIQLSLAHQNSSNIFIGHL
jgi:hypothetical protein